MTWLLRQASQRGTTFFVVFGSETPQRWSSVVEKPCKESEEKKKLNFFESLVKPQAND